MIEIEPPSNCTGEHSLLSYSTGFLNFLIEDHNSKCSDVTSMQSQRAWFKKRSLVVSTHKLRNEQINKAIIGNHWKPDPLNHIQNEVIYYPSGLNLENEGSRGIFLIGLSHRLKLQGKKPGDKEFDIVEEALRIAKQDMKYNSPWEFNLKDIII